MKALVMDSNRKISIKTVENSKMGKGIIVKVVASGICGTDLHMLKKLGVVNKDMILGHEFYGVIESIDKDVKINCINGSASVGDIITVVPGIVCNDCSYCKGLPLNENYCEKRTVFGLNCMNSEDNLSYGGNMENVFIPEKFAVYKINKNWPLGLGTLLEPVSVSVRAVNRANNIVSNVKDRNMIAVVVGLGTIGFFIGIALKKRGITVIGIEPEKSRRSRALNSGIDYAFGSMEEGVKKFEELKKKNLNNLGADMVFEAAGTPEAFENCFSYVRKGGVIVEVGNFLNAGNSSISANEICKKELNILGIVLADKYSYFEAEVLLNEYIDKSSEIIVNYSIDDFKRAYDNALSRKGGLKVNIIFD